MVKIEELLSSGENVIKKQSGVMVGGPGPAGDLHLTNRRLIFLNKKRWSILSFNPIGSLLGKDIIIPLENISGVSKTFNGIKVQADKEYQFVVGRFGKREGWVNTIQQAMRISASPSPNMPHNLQQTPPYQSIQRTQPVQRSQPVVQRFCTFCGKPASFIQQHNRWYCHSCQKYV